jgi:hypothetical protein
MRWHLVGIVVVLGSVTLSADFLEVRRSVTLKQKPVRSAQTVTQLQPPTRVELLSDTQENGYYRPVKKAGYTARSCDVIAERYH